MILYNESKLRRLKIKKCLNRQLEPFKNQLLIGMSGKTSWPKLKSIEGNFNDLF